MYLKNLTVRFDRSACAKDCFFDDVEIEWQPASDEVCDSLVLTQGGQRVVIPTAEVDEFISYLKEVRDR